MNQTQHEPKPIVPDNFGFYAILTNPVRGYEYCTSAVADAGIAFVQLRMKDASRGKIMATAEKMRKITAGTRTRLVINDYPDIAAQVDADGTHVGQDDLKYEQAREAAGPGRIIGISTHSPAQTTEACTTGADYIGVGPVFPTPTKKIPDIPIGIDGMKEMLALATVPAVALGSITLENLPHIIEAGAKNFCMLRSLNNSENPQKTISEILRVYGEFCGG